MPSFRYRALTQAGELVDGSILAPSIVEVAHRIDYLGLVPVGDITQEPSASASGNFGFGNQARSEDVTIFTLDIALLLKAGARLDAALDLLATDADVSRLHSTIASVRASILSGETFAEALAHHPALFPPIYLALVKVGEASGTLEHILEVLARQRTQAETLRRKVVNALRYPAFVLLAAFFVLLFFLTFVLPQFSAILRDFGAKIDPVAGLVMGTSDFVIANQTMIEVIAAFVLTGGFLASRRPKFRGVVISRVACLPGIRTIVEFHRTALFCRNLAVLVGAAVPLTAALRILADIMSTLGNSGIWNGVVERVRQGGKLSDALTEAAALPVVAVRMLRLGEESGQMPILAERIAAFYETKLERSLDRVVGIVGPLAIVTISIIVGGVIISVMTSLLSVSQLVG